MSHQHLAFRRELKKLDKEVEDIERIPKEKTTQKIFRESVKILILTSIISSIGGIGIESVKFKIISVLPFLILLPALNDMVGDFGSIIASRFTTMLYLKHFKRTNWWKSPKMHDLFITVLSVAALSAVYVTGLAYAIAFIKGFPFNILLFLELLCISLLASVFLVLILFAVSVIGGLYAHKHGHDPDNYLIPLATAVADLGSMLVLAGILRLFF
ncbi:MAG TPA: magnesium transporter [Candidatus Binatia bacterium]|nr:magnesium transporter [Candidatus Binatia bacterium]